ncbi:MAG TPA: Dam family site-specific DNA-(adenine-N6)-methyltransferase, partial [Chloroflexota bacterium]|nr:Dam family site-specific DNA-(adenine-N6)-methyltransferase [Chloroflexota bacterium]
MNLDIVGQAAASAFPRRLMPFLKWAGGKRQLLSQLAPSIPPTYDAYIEPFLGGGALYLALEPPWAILGDLNQDLIVCYQVIRDHLDALLTDLDRHVYDREYYYQVRAEDPSTLSSIARASRFLYLNKCGYNGLYRVNARGQFNVPFGRYATPPRLYHAKSIRAISALLRAADVRVAPYQETMDRAHAGDFVYLDPPYHPLSGTSSFTAYTAGAFGVRDQEELAAWYRLLDRRGCRLMLSNSSAPL